MKRKLFVLIGTFGLMMGLRASGAGGRTAPVNPDFTAWREKVIAARANATANASAGSGSTVTGLRPAPFDARYLVDLKKKRALKASAAAVSKGSLPTSYDLRTYGWVTSVKDQNPYGTCWAHGALASMESALLKSEGTTYDFSENNMVNLCGFTFTSMNSNGQPYPWDGKNEGGHYLMSLAYLLRWSGPVAETDDPYCSPGNSVAHDAQRHLIGCQWITQRTSALDNDDIKQAVLDHGAVAIDYYHSSSYLKGSSYYCPYSYSGNHLVAVVGWDDNYSKSNFSTKPSGNGAFLIKNSWGTSFGSSGYFWVSYYDKTLGYGNPMVSYYNVDPSGNYKNIYQYDELGFVGSMWTSEEGTGYGACIFTAKDSENISAVGFYALTDTTSYEISVRTGVSATDPSSGSLATTVSGTAPHLGYVIVSLPSAVKVAKGANFAVVMKLKTDDYEYPLAYAAVSSDYSEKEVISGKCYLNSGNSWQKTSEEDICLKVYSTADAGSSCEAAAGVWTTDVDGVKNASDCQLAVVLRANYSSCGWCQQAQSVFESSEFLTWARNNGVYLVTADSTHLPDGCTDTSAALNWFSTLYSSVSHSSGTIYFPTIAVARPDNFNQAVGYDVVRNDGSSTVGGVVYAGTAASLISGLSNYLGSSGDQPDAPTGLKASYTWNASASNYKVTLSWDNTWPSGTKFRIYRSSGTIADWDNPYADTTATSYTDASGLACGATMHYWVTAQPSGSMEGIAASVTATAPQTPSSSDDPVAIEGDDFTTGGTSSWYEQSEYTHDDVSAWRSGEIGNNQTNWLSTTVSGEGVLSFWWMTSSEYYYDRLELLVDGEVRDYLSGNYGWYRKVLKISGTGTHTIVWRYRKDGSGSYYLDAGFVDQVEWSAGAEVADLAFNEDAWEEGRYGIFVSKENDTVPCNLFQKGDAVKLAYSYSNVGAGVAKAPFSNWIALIDVDEDNGWTTAAEAYLDQEEDLESGEDATGTYMTTDWKSLSAGVYCAYMHLDDAKDVLEADPYDNYAYAAFAICDPVTLGTALDNTSLSFTTAGTGAWYGTKGYGSDGIDCAASPLTLGCTTNDLITTVSVSAQKIVSFKWKNISGYGNQLQFLVDGEVRGSLTGNSSGWQDCYVRIPAGSHTLTWRFARTNWNSGEYPDCGFVDQVSLIDVPTGPTCFGLFVGINNYQIGANTLYGCVTDANAMKMVCADYGDWQNYNMTVVTDYDATLARFKSEIANLASVAKSGDTVLIYDSGHGGSYTDDDGNYTKDTFLCTTDGYYEDTDFANDIAQFKSGVKVVVMLDTCHSAGMFKNKSAKSSKLSAATTSNPSFFDNFVANVSTAIDGAARIKGAAKATISSSDIGWIAAADYDTYSQDMYGTGLFTGFTIVDSGILAGNADANSDGKITFNELYEHSVALSSEFGFEQVAQAANVQVLDSVSLNNRTVSLATALDNADLDFDTTSVAGYEDGPASWVGQNINGICCARSAIVPYYNEARMTTTVSGMGTISFKWCTKAASNGELEFYVDGSYRGYISGDTAWTDVSFDIEDGGDHEVSWVYWRYYGSTGNDCGMVSDVVWSPELPTGISVSGPEVVRSGSLASYICAAEYSDGSSALVLPTWTITSGSAYATIDPSTGVLTAKTVSSSQTVTVKASYAVSGGAPMTATMTVTILPPGSSYPFGDALNNDNLTFGTGGDGDWYVQTEYSSDGVSAMRSGAIDNSQESWLETTVSGEGVLSFYWYVNSESGYDDLVLYVDGEFIDSISGTYYGDWHEKTLEILGEGTHTITWCYSKDGSVSRGLDAGFVDQVTWVAGAHLPNLKVLDVHAYDGADGLSRCLFNVGEDIRFSYSYENSGLGDVVSSYANYLNTYNSDYISYAWGSLDGETPLASGTAVNGTVTLDDLDGSSYLPAGVYIGYLDLDNGSEIAETEEDDNYVNFHFAVRDPESLGNALDNNTLSFTTSESDSWYGTKGYGNDGVDCAATLQTGNSTTNDLMTTVSGPKILSFKWKVSSEENYDWLQLLVDGEVKRQISGTADGWQDCQVKIPSGSHTVTWRYAKDSSGYSGVDCGWVDQVALSAVPSGSTCYGLFVGINRYRIGANTLSGCVTDANTMKMVCQDYGDWPLYGMTVVTDYAATLSRFKSEIASLAATAQPGDTVLIFDSGHGGSYTDDDGNYTKDTFLCTTDGYYEDSDFANDIAQFKSGVKVIVMLDTCHSAGMFKSKSSKSSELSAATTSNPSFFDNFVANVSATIDRSVRIKGASSATISSSDIGWIAAADYDTYSQDMYGTGLFTGFTIVDSGILAGNADANSDGKITFNELYEHSVALSSEFGFEQVAQAANVQVLDSVSLNNRTVSLATALDNSDLEFDTTSVAGYEGGPASWVGQDVNGTCCARSAIVPYYNEARMTTTVSGAGTISFKWRTEAANNGYLAFYVDGSCHYSTRRDTAWTDVYLKIEGDGDHEISWVYERYYGSTGNDCCMISDVAWTSVSDPTQVTVTFDPNGGECSEASRQVTVGERIGELPTPTWTEHSFLGWFTSNGVQVYDTTIIVKDVTLYAHWQYNPEPPNWKEEIVKKNLKMTVYARIRDVVAKVLIEHTDGLLAAFAANGECRGCTTFQTDDDVNLFGLSVGIDSVSETGFTLKYWSSATGVLDVIDGFDANADCQIGTFEEPVEYRVGALTVEVTIDEGWNWVSIPVRPDNLGVGSVLSGYTWSNGDIVEAADGASTYYNGKWRSGDFTEIVPGAGYCIRKSAGGSQTVEIAGAAIESSVAVEVGWNWIGSHSVDSVAMSDVMHSAGFVNGDVVNSADGMSTYYNGKWRSGDFSTLDPAAAYVAKFANAGVLTFGQSKSASANVKAMAVKLSMKGSAPTWQVVKMPKSVQLYCRISKSDGSGYIETAGSMLGAFTASGECRGATTIIVDEDGAVFSVKVGAETETEDGFVLKVWDAETGEIYDVQGTFGFSDAVSGSIGLYWEPVTKIATIPLPTTTEISFSANGGVGGPSGTVTATKGKAMPAISGVPTKTGYTFGGYCDDAGVKYYNADLTSAKNWDKDDATATLYAQWTANTYTVTFHSNFGTDQTITQHFTYDVEQELKANGWNYAGHSFLGWAETSGGQKKYEDGEAVKNLSDVANGNVDLYAKWDVQMITVIIGGVVQEYEYGRQVTLTPPANVVGEHGYTNLVCQGWSGGTGDVPATGTGSEVSFTVTQASTLNWLYQTNYWFEVKTDGKGSVSADGSAVGDGSWKTFGATINLEASADVANHYHFAGWKDTETEASIWTADPNQSFELGKPVLITACFALDTFTVKFVLGDYGTRSGGGELTQTVEYGGSAEAPTVTAKEGCIFKGWDSDDWKNVTGELTVNAVYDFTQYAINYAKVHGDNSANPTKYAITNETITFAAPKDIPTGYHFQGWSPASIAKGSTGDKTVTAQWKFDFAVDGGAAAEVASGESVTRTAPGEGTWGETNIVCTGWVGTGDVPAKGEGNTVTFTITQPSTLTWLYATNYMVRVNGGTLTDDKKTYELNGDWVPMGTKLTAKTELNATNNYVNLIYRGTYTGTGDVAGGTGRSVVFTVTQPSSVAWNYDTNYCFSVTKEGEGTLAFEKTDFEKEGYWPAGTSVKVTATADTSKHYHFAGWTDALTGASLGAETEKTFVLNAPMLVKAVFSLDTFTVTFVAGDKGEITSGDATQSVGYGQSAAAPTVTAKPGYKFTGWDKAFNNITGGLMVTAMYETLNYTITYEDTKGCNNANKTVFTVEDAVQFSALTNPPGWKFLGWEPSAIEKGTASNVTVTAQWEHIKYAIAIDGVAGDGLYYGDQATASTFAEKTVGYTNLVCIGWTGTGDVTSGIGTQVTFTVTQESSLTWLYQTNYWFEAAADGKGSVVVGADGFAAKAEGCWVPFGTNLVVTAIPAEHWHFMGWKDAEDGTALADADEATFSFVMDAPALLEATFAIDTFTVVFDLGEFGVRTGGGELKQTVAYGKGAVAPELSVDEGHAFVGWDMDFDVVTGDIVVAAQYDEMRFAIRYDGTMDCDNSANPTHYMTTNDLVVFSALTNPPGWKFLGWEPKVIEKGTEGAVTVTAQWEHLKYELNVGGVTSDDHYYGDVITLAQTPQQVSGYTNLVCLGWTGSGDVPASGVGTQVTFTVTQKSAIGWLYETNYWFEAAVDGEGSIAVGADGFAADVAGCWVPFGTNLVVTAVPTEHWHTTGWVDVERDVPVSSEAVLTVEMTGPALLAARFALDTFEVTFDVGDRGKRSGGGELTQTVEYGKAAVAPTLEVETGYTFTGWDEKFDVVTGDLTVFATYEDTKYAITYTDLFDCDNAANPTNYTISDTVTFADPAKRSGWTFLGWEPAGIEAGTTGDLTVKALWREVPEIIDSEDFEQGDAPAVEKKAANYVGYLYKADDGTLAGTVKVTAGKGSTDRKTGAYTSKISVAIQLANETKKISISGKYDLTNMTAQTFSNNSKPSRSVTLLLGEDGMTGTFEGYTIGGVLKATESADYQGSYNIFSDEGQFVVTIDKKGTAKVAGTTTAGKLVSASVALLKGEVNACVPVAVPKYNLAFTFWLTADEIFVEGLTNAEVGTSGTLAEGATFQIDSDELADLIGDETFSTYFPNGLSVAQNEKNKWIVAPDENGKAGKTGSVVLNKDGSVNEKKLGENPSALKLTYTAKNGTFTGSFKAYYSYQASAKSAVKAKAVSFKVKGILVNGIGYGTASAKIGKETVVLGLEIK